VRRASICGVNTRHTAEAPVHVRGDGHVSHLLLAGGDFGSRHLAITWVECEPGSQQALHAHPESEQAYVIVAGRGTMIVGDEERTVDAGTLVYIPPRADHAIRATGDGHLVYLSATSPPFAARVSGGAWVPTDLARADEPG
jgi:mannose-6-phosphate isomerase-like protein (cupin superfamily)